MCNLRASFFCKWGNGFGLNKEFVNGVTGQGIEEREVKYSAPFLTVE